MREIRRAWREREVRLGLYGTLLITLGSLTPAYLPQASPVWSVLRVLNLTGPITKVVGTLIVLVGLLLLILAWFRLRATRDLRHWAVLLIWSLPFLVSPPVFSHDAYSYAAHGWLIQSGLNPYEVGPGVLPGVFADQVAWVWRNTTTPYGPLSLTLSWGLDALTGFDPFWSAMAMRVPALIGVGLIGFFLPKIAEIRGGDRWMVGWMGILNPVLVIDYVGGAHNDALMVGLVVLAIWVTCRTKWWLAGAVIVGVGMAIKQPALLAAVALPFLIHTWASWRIKPTLIAVGRVLASLAVAIGVFVLISLACGFGFGWINAVNVPGKVITVSPFTIMGWLAQMGLYSLLPGLPDGMALTGFRVLGIVTMVVVILYLAITKLGTRPIYFLSWSYIWFSLCAPAFHSWYVLWGGVLLPLTKPSERVIRLGVVSTMVMLCYAAINFGNRNQSLALGVVVVGAIYWMMRTHHKSHAEEAESVGSAS